MSVEWAAGVLADDAVRTALVAGVLASVALGVVGTLVVVKREVFLATGVAHAAYGGVGLGFFLALDPTWGAMAFGVAAAVAMGLVRRVARQRTDTLIAVMWGVGLSVGVILVDLTPGPVPAARGYLFGDILDVSPHTLVLLVVCTVAIVAGVGLWYRPLIGLLSDREFVAARGLPVLALELGVLGLVALAVVVLVQVVGVILMVGQLAIPAALGARFARSLGSAMLAATGIGLVTVLGGITLSATASVAAGPAIVCVSAATFAAVTGVAAAAAGIRGRRASVSLAR
jgi:zinc transport system permease protein